MDKKVAQVYLAQYVGLKTEADHMEQIADEELKSVQQPRIDASKRKMAEIRKAVESIDDPLQRTVLHARYIDCRNGRLTTWPQIALQIYGSNTEAKMKATYRLHNKALEALSVPVDPPSEPRGFLRSFFSRSSVKGN